jgi:hypothetical protein
VRLSAKELEHVLLRMLTTVPSEMESPMEGTLTQTRSAVVEPVEGAVDPVTWLDTGTAAAAPPLCSFLDRVKSGAPTTTLALILANASLNTPANGARTSMLTCMRQRIHERLLHRARP